MWEKILELAIGDGLWALLFCTLLVYQLKDSRAREVKYQATISSLSQDLGYLKELDESIEDIDKTLRGYVESIVNDTPQTPDEAIRNVAKGLADNKNIKESA